MTSKISGLIAGLAILVGALGLGWPETRPALLHADDRDWDSPHIAPFVTTPHEVVSRMLELAEIKKGDVLYDLGSGDGRIVVAAAKKFGIRAVGFEIDPGLVKDSRQLIKQAGLEELVEIREQDIRTVDFSPASVVTMYLYPAANLRLRPVLMRELKPGSRVISHDFGMGSWKPDRVERLQDIGGLSRTIYRWRIVDPPGR
jgi:SAM-dependent methyltransferase